MLVTQPQRRAMFIGAYALAHLLFCKDCVTARAIASNLSLLMSLLQPIEDFDELRIDMGKRSGWTCKGLPGEIFLEVSISSLAMLLVNGILESTACQKN